MSDVGRGSGTENTAGRTENPRVGSSILPLATTFYARETVRARPDLGDSPPGPPATPPDCAFAPPDLGAAAPDRLHLPPDLARARPDRLRAHPNLPRAHPAFDHTPPHLRNPTTPAPCLGDNPRFSTSSRPISHLPPRDVNHSGTSSPTPLRQYCLPQTKKCPPQETPRSPAEHKKSGTAFDLVLLRRREMPDAISYEEEL
jgi:hypothetical protein